MKKTLFATAFAVAALAAAPAFAQVLAQSTGYVGASVSHSQAELFGFEDDFESFGVQGAVAVPIHEDDLSAQINLGYSDSAEAEGALSGSAYLVSHLDGGRIGGFVGAAEVGDEVMMAYGAQGDVHLTNTTLSAGATFATVNELDIDVWQLNGEARFFTSDNLRIDVGAGWLTGDVMGFETDAWTAGVGGEYQFAGPVSVFGGYDRFDLQDLDLTIDTFSVGVRYNFGGGTLRDRDRAGASFGGLGNLAQIASF